MRSLQEFEPCQTAMARWPERTDTAACNAGPRWGGLAGWLWARWRSRSQARPHLELVERISLAPRQSLALVDADGRRILVATSAEGSPALYPLEDRPLADRPRTALANSAPRRPQIARSARVSW